MLHRWKVGPIACRMLWPDVVVGPRAEQRRVLVVGGEDLTRLGVGRQPGRQDAARGQAAHVASGRPITRSMNRTEVVAHVVERVAPGRAGRAPLAAKVDGVGLEVLGEQRERRLLVPPPRLGLSGDEQQRRLRGVVRPSRSSSRRHRRGRRDARRNSCGDEGARRALCGPKRCAYAPTHTHRFRIVPMPSIHDSSTSPGCSEPAVAGELTPTPAGVPVKITSPGRSGSTAESSRDELGAR